MLKSTFRLITLLLARALRWEFQLTDAFLQGCDTSILVRESFLVDTSRPLRSKLAVSLCYYDTSGSYYLICWFILIVCELISLIIIVQHINVTNLEILTLMRIYYSLYLSKSNIWDLIRMFRNLINKFHSSVACRQQITAFFTSPVP